VSITEAVNHPARGGFDAANKPRDAVLFVKAPGDKELLRLYWTLSTQGACLANPVGSRLLVIDGGAPAGLVQDTAAAPIRLLIPANGNTITDPGTVNETDLAGRVMLDVDVMASQFGQSSGSFDFNNDSADEGRMLTSGGSILIVLTAPRSQAAANLGALAVGVEAKVVAIWGTRYNKAMTRDYNHVANSRPMRGDVRH
jgi:hypothetical protein